MCDNTLNQQIRSYMTYIGQKYNMDYYEILYKLPKEILFKHGYYNLKLLCDSIKNKSNCNILTFDNVDFCNNVEFEFMLNLINNINQINDLRFKSINLHNYINELSKFIKSNYTIKSLSLNISEIDDKDLKQLCEVIKENDTLSSLNFSSNNSFSNITPICDLIQCNKRIDTLQLYNIYNCDLIPLIECLKTNNSIKTLKINLIDNIFDNIYEMLMINNTINNLMLNSMNHFNSKKVKDIMQKENITKLSLSNSSTDDWNQIIEGLTNNKHLIKIDLNNCSIEDYKPFYKIIKNNSTLKVINLNHNCMTTDNNSDILIDALQNNNVIEKVFVKGIIIKDTKKYLDTIIGHSSLKEINAEINYEDRQLICNKIYYLDKVINFGYQEGINYKKYYKSTDKNKRIGQFVYGK